jgi:hypothetical protein
MPRYRQLGNLFFVALVRLLFGGRYTDLCYGYNAFWKNILPALAIDASGFEVETMMNIRVLRSGLTVREVPSFEAARVYGEGRLRTIPDGWRVLRTILEERLLSAPLASVTGRSRAPIGVMGILDERVAVPVEIESSSDVVRELVSR